MGSLGTRIGVSPIPSNKCNNYNDIALSFSWSCTLHGHTTRICYFLIKHLYNTRWCTAVGRQCDERTAAINSVLTLLLIRATVHAPPGALTENSSPQ